MTEQLRSLVIVGGGTAGWLSAAMLRRFVPEGTSITLVESDAIGTIGVGEATIPQFRLLTAGLGIDEDELLAATQGTFKLGIEFVDWAQPGSRYMHAFGQVGRGWGVTPFHHYWLRGKSHGLGQPLGDYIVSAAAAAADRFSRHTRQDLPVSHAFHLDASRLAAFLRRVAERAGVARVEGIVAGADRAMDGDIRAVRLEDGREIEADFFLDCSGFRSLLLGEALDVGFEDWSRWLPCDRAVAVQCEQPGPLHPYTRATARTVGWQWRIPLQQRIGNGLVYSSAHLSDDSAAARLLGALDGPPMGDPRPIRFTTGKRHSFWTRNVVAIGLAAGFMEPLESTSIHMIQSALARLLEFFPRRGPNSGARAAYDRLTHAEFDRIRDFLILHYQATVRQDPFWRDCRAHGMPETLVEKIELFRTAGLVKPDADELFTEPAWLQVMIGQGIVPENWSPLANTLSDDALVRFLDRVRSDVADAVHGMNEHRGYVANHCPDRIEA